MHQAHYLSDGGGVRGYSSLLILQELVSIIMRLEEGSLEDASEHHQREVCLAFIYMKTPQLTLY